MRFNFSLYINYEYLVSLWYSCNNNEKIYFAQELHRDFWLVNLEISIENIAFTN